MTIDLTDCRHILTQFADLTTDQRNWFAVCRACGAHMWQTPEWDRPTVTDVFDIYEGLVHGEAAADEMTNPGTIALQARTHLAAMANTVAGRRSIAQGVWVAVHPASFQTVLTTNSECADWFVEARLYVVPPTVWDDAVDRTFRVWQAEQRDRR